MVRRGWLLIPAIMILFACSSGDGGGEISSPCALADVELVGSVFSGTVAEGVEGEFQNCDFEVEGGPVLTVSVFDYGSSSGWDSTRDGFVDNREGVTDVDGIGQAAFFPNDTGARELIVQSGGRIFSVTVFSGFDEPSVEVINGVADLAKAIADDLGA